MPKSASRRLPAPQEAVSKKIQKVAHEHPELTHKQVVGRAIGTLEHEKKKKGGGK